MTDFHKPEQSGQAAALPGTYVQHPLSAAFPAMTPEEFQELKDSIEVLGVQNPITLHDGMVIDGWHRYSAAREVGLPCPVVNLAQDIDPREFVMAQNGARRHITQAQIAVATVTVYQWRKEGRPEKLGTQCPVSEKQKSTAELSEIAGVGERTIKQAKTVTAQAAPAVVEAGQSQKMGSATDRSTTRTSSTSWPTGSGTRCRAMASAWARRARSRRCRLVGAAGAVGAVRQPSARHSSGNVSIARISGF